ncbi:hypothetical protein LX36DRAFT_84414 [Colletotrichum falcatum]|nr:hypothetical protein LX36DRAFT_84414 [Colletotrichum falcatum]
MAQTRPVALTTTKRQDGLLPAISLGSAVSAQSCGDGHLKTLKSLFTLPIQWQCPRSRLWCLLPEKHVKRITRQQGLRGNSVAPPPPPPGLLQPSRNGIGVWGLPRSNAVEPLPSLQPERGGPARWCSGLWHLDGAIQRPTRRKTPKDQEEADSEVPIQGVPSPVGSRKLILMDS